MLFSGTVRSYHCSQCDNNFSEAIPTSIIPIIFVLFISGTCWLYSLEILLNNRLLALIIALITNLSSFLLTFYFTDKIMCHKFNKNICPLCDGKLEAIQGGFYDGGLPTRIELIIYIITLLIPALLVLFVNLFTGL